MILTIVIEKRVTMIVKMIMIIDCK